MQRLLDRWRMAATLVAQQQREDVVFENYQVEADETVVREERVYEDDESGNNLRAGIFHHLVICLTQRGRPKQVLYPCEPKFVPVAAGGKPSPPPLPTVDLLLPVLSKHLGQYVVLHTGGAEAYSAACKRLQEKGATVVRDHVVHSQGQWTAFGRQDVTKWTDWEGCAFALTNDKGEMRIRVIKGIPKD